MFCLFAPRSLNVRQCSTIGLKVHMFNKRACALVHSGHHRRRFGHGSWNPTGVRSQSLILPKLHYQVSDARKWRFWRQVRPKNCLIVCGILLGSNLFLYEKQGWLVTVQQHQQSLTMHRRSICMYKWKKHTDNRQMHSTKNHVWFDMLSSQELLIHLQRHGRSMKRFSRIGSRAECMKVPRMP